MPSLSPILNFLQQQMQTQPGLFAATVALIVASSYVLLMVATRVGDIKPGIQSLVLSAAIHLAMVMFWGNLALPPGKMVRHRAPAEPIPIRQVIVENQDGADSAAIGTETGTGTDANSRPVWDRIASAPKDEFTRSAAAPGETMPVDVPERTREAVESVKSALPDLPSQDEVAVTAPQPLQVAESTQRRAADQLIDIPDETAESRPDVALANVTPKREVADRVGQPSGAVEREVRQGRPAEANVTVQMSSQPTTSDTLLDESSKQRTPAEIPVAQRRTAPVPNAVEMEDPGALDGTATGAVAAGSPNPGRFSRAGRPIARNDVAGTVERSRTTVRPEGNNPRAPAIASLSPGSSRDAALPTTDRPGISRPNFNAIPQRESAKVPDTYRLRNLPQRQKVAVRLGATQNSERAVELSLRWLSQHQNAEGYWDADGFDAHCPASDRCLGRAGKGNPSEVEKINNPVDRVALAAAGQQSDTGLTALVILTFLGAGYTQEEGQYADHIDRAVRWMIRQQQSNGYLGGKASHYERMYCHGMATYALGEACGMLADPDSDPQLRQTLTKAVGFITAMQNPTDGGWRYMDGHLPKQEGDMSMFGWQLMALKSSEIAGVEVPADTQAGMIKFLRRISTGERRGLASYRFGEAPKASMTAEALFSRQMLGMKRENPSSLEAIEFLTKHPPRQTEQDLYYWYYGTLAMYQYGGEPWRRWNDQLRDTLVATQRKQGHAAGSWDPRDNWSLHGGRLYSTALSTLCLEVYYRFLPLYQLNEAPINNMAN
ncbi:MAG: hypothetical protein V4719_25200 [Planctomycetota bacterium]